MKDTDMECCFACEHCYRESYDLRYKCRKLKRHIGDPDSISKDCPLSDLPKEIQS